MIKHELAKNASMQGMGGGSGSSLATTLSVPQSIRVSVPAPQMTSASSIDI
ncbi:MAG: hypothetical protein J5802_09285 [Butyrivibrio sp.]|nr:hypothetical protein [Butyrivibrio sp.]